MGHFRLVADRDALNTSGNIAWTPIPAEVFWRLSDVVAVGGLRPNVVVESARHRVRVSLLGKNSFRQRTLDNDRDPVLIRGEDACRDIELCCSQGAVYSADHMAVQADRRIVCLNPHPRVISILGPEALTLVLPALFGYPLVLELIVTVEGIFSQNASSDQIQVDLARNRCLDGLDRELVDGAAGLHRPFEIGKILLSGYFSRKEY